MIKKVACCEDWYGVKGSQVVSRQDCSSPFSPFILFSNFVVIVSNAFSLLKELCLAFILSFICWQMASEELGCHWVSHFVLAVSLYSCDVEWFPWDVSYKRNMFCDSEELVFFFHIPAKTDSDLYCSIGEKFLLVVEKIPPIKVRKRAFTALQYFRASYSALYITELSFF